MMLQQLLVIVFRIINKSGPQYLKDKLIYLEIGFMMGPCRMSIIGQCPTTTPPCFKGALHIMP